MASLSDSLIEYHFLSSQPPKPSKARRCLCDTQAMRAPYKAAQSLCRNGRRAGSAKAHSLHSPTTDGEHRMAGGKADRRRPGMLERNNLFKHEIRRCPDEKVTEDGEEIRDHENKII